MLKKLIKKTYKNFVRLSNLNKVLVLIASYFVLKHVQSIMSWVYWNSGMYILEGFGQPSKFTLFHWKDCGHCKNMMPEWDKFHSANNTAIKTSKVEKDDNPTLLKKYNINSFPTILLLDDAGQVIETYKGERTKDAFTSFIESKL